MAGKLLRRRYDDKKTSARDDERSFFLRDAMGWPTVTANSAVDMSVLARLLGSCTVAVNAPSAATLKF